MSKISLKLAGENIPMPPDTEIAITYKASDVRNIGNRDGSYAETFTLPDTNLVRRALGNSQFVTSATETPYRLLPASIELDGNPVLSGTAAHTEVNEGFAVDVDGQNANLFAVIKGRKLADIDLSDLDHTFDNATVGTSNSHDLSRGFLYPLINYGRFTDRELKTGNVRFDELRPAVYVLTLLERMAAPFTLTGSILNDAKFKKLVVPFTNRYFQYRQSFVEPYRARVELTYDKALAPGLADYMYADNILTDEAEMLESQGTDIYAARVPMDGNYEVNASLKVSTNISGAGVFTVMLLRIRAATPNETWFTTDLTSGDSQSVQIDVAVQNCKAGDLLYIIVIPAFTSSDNYLLTGSYFEVKLQNVVFPGNPVHLEANLPDVTQEDLLLAVCNMFNLLIQTDPVRKIYRLDSLERMYYQNPVDWSKKIDWLNKPRFVFALENYGQRSLLSYGENEDTDFIGNPITDSMVFTVDNEQLEPEKELFTSAFTFTQMRPAFRGAVTLPFIPLFNQAVINFELWNPDKNFTVATENWVYANGDYWSVQADNTNSFPTNSNTNWEKQTGPRVFEELEATPRFLLVETRTESVAVGEDYQPTSTYPLTTYGTFAGLESDTLQDEYHGITEMMLEQTRVMALNVRLRLPDINALDFLRPVMLNIPAKNLQGMFYLNAINQFRPDRYDSTEVELVRLYGMKLKAEAIETGHEEFSEEFSGEFA